MKCISTNLKNFGEGGFSIVWFFKKNGEVERRRDVFSNGRLKPVPHPPLLRNESTKKFDYSPTYPA